MAFGKKMGSRSEPRVLPAVSRQNTLFPRKVFFEAQQRREKEEQGKNTDEDKD